VEIGPSLEHGRLGGDGLDENRLTRGPRAPDDDARQSVGSGTEDRRLLEAAAEHRVILSR